MPQATLPVTWFEIYVDDLERAVTFYQEVLGFDLSPLPDDGTFRAMAFQGRMPAPGASGALMEHPMRPASSGGTIVYFHCDDCATLVERVVAAGSVVLRPRWSLGAAGFCALVSDSEGNIIGLHSFR